MPRASKDIKESDILRFLRFSVVESAAATFTESEFDTQLSVYAGFIWMIAFMEIDGMTASSIDDAAQGANEELNVQITRESKSALVNYNDSDLIEKVRVETERYATIGTDAGPVVLLTQSPIIITYPIPLPYAGQSIYIGVQSTAGAAKTVRGRIGYTIKKVSDKFFFRVAQSLLT